MCVCGEDGHLDLLSRDGSQATSDKIWTTSDPLDAGINGADIQHEAAKPAWPGRGG